MTNAGEFHRAWRALPLGSLTSITGPGTALVLAPHPDDESLGCGGLIAASVAAGRPPLVVILTDGAGSHHSRAFPPERLRTQRAQEARDAVVLLGLPADRIVFLGQPDTAAPTEGPAFREVVDALTALIRTEADCTSILAPWRYDPHCDHEAASHIAEAVAGRARVKSVAYPVWGWTLPADHTVPSAVGPGWRLDISAFRQRKQQAILAHRTQYGGLITDDPAGFQLPEALLSAFDSPFETFLQA